MICGLEIAMFVWGIIVMVTGKLKVSKNKEVRGTAARLLAVFMLAPFPLAFGFGIIYGMLNAGAIHNGQAIGLLTAAEAIIVLGCAIAAVVGGLILGKPPLPTESLRGFPVQDTQNQPPQPPV